jgi:hypothetical protein
MQVVESEYKIIILTLNESSALNHSPSFHLVAELVIRTSTVNSLRGLATAALEGSPLPSPVHGFKVGKPRLYDFHAGYSTPPVYGSAERAIAWVQSHMLTTLACIHARTSADLFVIGRMVRQSKCVRNTAFLT